MWYDIVCMCMSVLAFLCGDVFPFEQVVAAREEATRWEAEAKGATATVCYLCVCVWSVCVVCACACVGICTSNM